MQKNNKRNHIENNNNNKNSQLNYKLQNKPQQTHKTESESLFFYDNPKDHRIGSLFFQEKREQTIKKKNFSFL